MAGPRLPSSRIESGSGPKTTGGIRVEFRGQGHSSAARPACCRKIAPTFQLPTGKWCKNGESLRSRQHRVISILIDHELLKIQSRSVCPEQDSRFAHLPDGQLEPVARSSAATAGPPS